MKGESGAAIFLDDLDVLLALNLVPPDAVPACHYHFRLPHQNDRAKLDRYGRVRRDPHHRYFRLCRRVPIHRLGSGPEGER